MFEGFEQLKRLQYIAEFYCASSPLSAFTRLLKSDKTKPNSVFICGVVQKTKRIMKDQKLILIATLADRTDSVDLYVGDDASDIAVFEHAQKNVTPVLCEVSIYYKKGSEIPNISLRSAEIMMEVAARIGDPIVVELKEGVKAVEVFQGLGPAIDEVNKLTAFEKDPRGIVVVLENHFEKRIWKNYKVQGLCVGAYAPSKTRKAILDIIAANNCVGRVMSRGKQHVVVD